MESALRLKLPGGKFLKVSKKRSKIMASIRGKHNKTTDYKLRMLLIKNNIKGWKLHSKEIFGTPDFYFSKKKLAIFVDGCFWHGCKSCGHIPKTRSAFWRTKFERNQIRAKLVKSKLREHSIEVMRIWEHVFENPSKTSRVIQNISSYVSKNSRY